MQQNIIAVIWDFDKTLIKGYMQKPIFEKFNVDGSLFWKEVNGLHEKYQNQGIKINKDTIYLNHFITCVKQDIFKELNNNMLRELGGSLEFYNGIPAIFKDLKEVVKKEEKYRVYDMKLEHYIVSTGLTEMIKGSKISKDVEGIWGCEFIETPIKSNIDIKEYKKAENNHKVISQVGYAIDNTSKTRAIFEINKGVNIYQEMDVNSNIPENKRRIPIENMIYIADGPSDVPVFSLLKQNNGATFGVYEKNNEKEFKQVEQLRKDGRIDMYGEADYSQGTQTYMWLCNQVKDIAEKIYIKMQDKIYSSVSKPPRHITE